MNNTATNRVMDTGISPVTSWADPVTKHVINFVVPGNQDMSSGFVYAVPTEHSKRMVEAAREKPATKSIGHYNALKQFSPSMKPTNTSALGLQNRGMQQEQKLMARARVGRYAALKAAPVTPKPSGVGGPQPMPKPMPQNMVISVGQIAAKTPEQTSRPALKVVPANKTSKKPQSLQSRMNYWGAGMACNIG